MSDKDNGGPAFPQTTVLDNASVCQGGMTLRDWFAGQALAGICANERLYSATLKSEEENKSEPGITLAIYCGVLADAMLKAREQ